MDTALHDLVRCLPDCGGHEPQHPGQSGSAVRPSLRPLTSAPIPASAAGLVQLVSFVPPAATATSHSYDNTGGTATTHRDRLVVPEDGLYDITFGAEVKSATDAEITYAEAAVAKNTTSATALAAPTARIALPRRSRVAWRSTGGVRIPLRAEDWLTLHFVATGAPWQVPAGWSADVTFLHFTWAGEFPA